MRVTGQQALRESAEAGAVRRQELLRFGFRFLTFAGIRILVFCPSLQFFFLLALFFHFFPALLECVIDLGHGRF